MNGLTMKRDAYLEAVQNMCGPYKPADIPKIKMNLRELVKYAKSINKKVPELSDEEINRYISSATMDDVRNFRIIVPGAEYAN
jgi:hypothetical protein